MRITDTQIPAPVIDVLRAANITEDRVALVGQLDRKTYTDTAAVLDRVGGKWNKKEKAHTFQIADDVRAVIAEMLDTGQMPRAENKNPDAFFPTPPNIVEQMLDLCGAREGERWDELGWLEPSAGEGAIVAGILLRGVAMSQISACEVNEERWERLRQMGVDVLHGDFLSLDEWIADRVVMNPPFAVKGDSLAYITHIEHAFQMLKPNGILSAIAPSSVLYRTDKRTAAFREKVCALGEMKRLPDNAFKESGTSVSTALLWMVKP